ncbi:MAG: hypothetical protein AB7O66_20660 [Limisphaerales bacterium]
MKIVKTPSLILDGSRMTQDFPDRHSRPAGYLRERLEHQTWTMPSSSDQPPILKGNAAKYFRQILYDTILNELESIGWTPEKEFHAPLSYAQACQLFDHLPQNGDPCDAESKLDFLSVHPEGLELRAPKGTPDKKRKRFRSARITLVDCIGSIKTPGNGTNSGGAGEATDAGMSESKSGPIFYLTVRFQDEVAIPENPAARGRL